MDAALLHAAARPNPAEQRSVPVQGTLWFAFGLKSSSCMQGGYWAAKAANSWEAFDLVDVFEISPVVGKDPEAAAAAEKAKYINAWKPNSNLM